MSAKEFSKLAGIDRRNFRRVIQRAGIAAREMRHGKHSRLMIRRSSALMLLGKGSKIFTMRQASAKLGIAVPVLRELKREGVFEAKVRPGMKGFHEADIHAFQDRVLAAAGKVSSKVAVGTTLVSLQRVFISTRITVAEKVRIIRKILAGKMSGIKKTDETIGGILIPGDSFRKVKKKRWKIRKHDEATRSSWNSVKVAAKIKIPQLVVRGLIRDGLLEVERPGREWLISKKSVTKFQMKYQSIVRVAKSLGVSPAVVT